MIGVSKVMIIFGIVLTTILYWASSNVCRYNFAIDKKSNILNIITQEIDPSLYQSRTFYFKELNEILIEEEDSLIELIHNFKTKNLFYFHMKKKFIKKKVKLN